MSEEPTVLELKPFQNVGADFLARRKKALLFDEMGLGKTAQLIAATERMDYAPQKTVILGSKSALPVWIRELPKWSQRIKSGEPVKLITATNKNVGVRDKLWREAFNAPGITLANYDTWRIDHGKGIIPEGWDHFIADEAHQISNHQTQRWESVKRLGWDAKSAFLATGTPMRRGPRDIYGLMHLLWPRIFSSYWKFVRTWHNVEKNAFGLEIQEPRNVEAFKRMLTSYAIQRLKRDVAPEVPAGFRSILPVQFDEQLLDLYEQLEEESITELPDENLVVNTNTLVRLLHLRQYCVSPKLLSPDLPYGPALDKVGEILVDSDNHHCVVYTQYAEALPIFRDYFVSELGVADSDIFTLQGGTHPSEVAFKSRRFQDRRGVMLCTVDFAQSFEFLTPDKVFFIGFSWDPFKNKQAEDRTSRLITRVFVNYYYLVVTGTVDERVLEQCVWKNVHIGMVAKTADDLRKLFYGR